MLSYDKPSPVDLAHTHEVARIHIEAARTFFQDTFAVSISPTGKLLQPVTPQQLEQLHGWRQQTFKGGADMPTVDVFFQKTLLAVALWPQKRASKIQYLFGKGQAVEVALFGVAVGREVTASNFPFRSHSDFDLYGVSEQVTYSSEFKQVFGAQETYPPTQTKGLHNLPPEFLHDTAQVVMWGETEIMVPELEVLFLDKLLKPESTPRAEGTDAELLARHYVLDATKLHGYAERFVIQPETARITESYHRLEVGHVHITKLKYGSTRRLLQEELGRDPTHDEVVAALNDAIRMFKDSTQGRFLVELSSMEIDNEGTLTAEGIHKQKEQLEQKKAAQLASVIQVHTAIDKILKNG